MDKKICQYCDTNFRDQNLLDKHQNSSKYCVSIQKKIKPIEDKYDDMKRYYELSLINLQTKLFQLQGQNMIYKDRITFLHYELQKANTKKSSWF